MQQIAEAIETGRRRASPGRSRPIRDWPLIALEDRRQRLRPPFPVRPRGRQLDVAAHERHRGPSEKEFFSPRAPGGKTEERGRGLYTTR